MRTTSRKNADGSVVRYVQLAHNEWDQTAGCAKAKVLFNLGRYEQVDVEALKRLVASISRFLSPEDALEAQASVSAQSPLRFVSSRRFGGAWTLDQLWRRLGIQRVLVSLLEKRRFEAPIERAIFAMVANRALAPSSKLAVENWVATEVAVPELEGIPVHQLYRAMDFLREATESLQQQVFFAAADLLNLEVDLLYFDTTSTYFELDEEEPDLRRRGHSKDHRPDLPQAVIGLAVTRDGIPVRCWVWPGNTADSTVITKVKDDLVGWRLGRVITVVDRGFTSDDNLRYLQRTGGHYIAGVRLRSGKPGTEMALNRAGRFHTIRDNLEVKEIVVGNGEARKRYVLVRNPHQAQKDRETRDKLLRRLQEELAQLHALHPGEHPKAACALLAHPVYGRYLRTDKKGGLHLNQAKVREEEKLDGKYLLETSDDTLTPEDVALGYKQLLEVEDAFRTLKQTLELRPVYHHLEDRIRTHVLLCWLALLLVRVAEHQTGQTWRQLRNTLDTMHLGEFAGPDGRLLQRTEATAAQRQIFAKLQLPDPPLFMELQPTPVEKI